jgi:hypothetical protein
MAVAVMITLKAFDAVTAAMTSSPRRATPRR